MKSIIFICIMLLLSVSEYAFAGDLEPSGPPNPTMKTLDEVEPRIPIPGSETATSTYTINQSGSYYLTGDLVCSATGIQVDTDDVTIDLMGYNLFGSGTGSGVRMTARSNVEIRNGTICNFNWGIFENDSLGRGHRAIFVRSIGNASDGIFLYSYDNLVKDCTVRNNVRHGIYVGLGSSVIGNTVCENGTYFSFVYGIRVGDGSTITNNTSFYNGRYGGSGSSTIYGIYASGGCTVTNNAVYGNGYSATGDIYGIYLYGSCLVDQNTAYRNGYTNGGTDIRSCITCAFGTNSPHITN